MTIFSSSYSQYNRTGIGATGLVALCFLYTSLHRGTFELNALNASTADAALILIGIILMIGPLSRMNTSFSRLLSWRKALGIAAMGIALIHVYLSMVTFARSGPWGLFQFKPFSAYPGAFAMGMLIVLFLITSTVIKKQVPLKLWWRCQYWGVRIAFVSIMIHMAVLKYEGWIEWVRDIAWLPPLSLVSFGIGMVVIFIRVIDLRYQKQQNHINL